MNSYNGKAVKLQNNTLELVESYRANLISSCNDFNMERYISEMSYDKIIHSALATVILIQNKLGEDFYFIITDERQDPKD